MTNLARAFTSVVSVAMLAGSQSALADGHGEITVGYFLEWPMPFLAAKAAGTYDDALGVRVNWRAFETGTAMSVAMASGDVQIAISQGLPPFVVATSAGQDLQIIDVAVSYSENDNCVVASGLEIDKETAADLAGKKVSVPLGTASHYGFLRQLDHFGIDLATLDIVNMSPPDGAAALAQGAVDVACGWGAGLASMKEYGNVLLTGAEKEELGILVFDVTSAPADYIAENEETVAAFLKVTAQANAEWNAHRSDDMLEVISSESGMDIEAARAAISTMEFPSIDAQLSQKWLGGDVQVFMKRVADVFLQGGSLYDTLDSYNTRVNISPLARLR